MSWKLRDEVIIKKIKQFCEEKCSELIRVSEPISFQLYIFLYFLQVNLECLNSGHGVKRKQINEFQAAKSCNYRSFDKQIGDFAVIKDSQE